MSEDTESTRRRAECPRCGREVSFRSEGSPMPHNSPSGEDGKAERCPGSRKATPPVLRPRKKGDSARAIADPSDLGGVLACGGCGDAVESFEVESWTLHGQPRAALKNVPCGCAVVAVPIWARNAAPGARDA